MYYVSMIHYSNVSYAVLLDIYSLHSPIQTSTRLSKSVKLYQNIYEMRDYELLSINTYISRGKGWV